MEKKTISFCQSAVYKGENIVFFIDISSLLSLDEGLLYIWIILNWKVD